MAPYTRHPHSQCLYCWRPAYRDTGLLCLDCLDEVVGWAILRAWWRMA